MFRKLVLTSCAALAFGGAALAADLPITVPAALPAPERFNWTGPYVGANLGYSWSDSSILYVGDSTFLNDVVGTGILPPRYDFAMRGLIGGLQIGYNYQIDQIVLGIEADIQLADLRGSVGMGPTLSNPSFTATAYTELDWFATLRGRLGFALDRTLLYVTGGLMLGHVDAGGTLSTRQLFLALPPVFANWAGSSSDIRLGWTVGAGVEWAFAKDWSLKLEYLYYNLRHTDVTLIPLDAAAVSAGFVPVQRHDIDGHIARIGLNYHF